MAQGSLVVKLVATLTKTVAITTFLLRFVTLIAPLAGRLCGAVTVPHAFMQQGGMWGLLRW
jgi:hypothetical protein